MKFIAVKFLFTIWSVLTFIPSVIFSVVYHPVARKLSWKSLPEAAKKIGLNHKKSSNFSEFGELYGTVNSHSVNVNPDENSKVIVFFNTPRPIQFWTEKYREKPKDNMPEFKTENRIFNRIFKTRRASKPFAEKINSSPELLNLFNDFYLKWIWSLGSIYISDKAIYSEFKYGYPFFSYIPPANLKKIITDMISLADRIDLIN